MRNRTRARNVQERNDVDMTPMLDIVFIMLIFFVVTASFVLEAGVPVHGLSPTPETEPVDALETLAVRIEDGNVIRIEGRIVDVGAVTANLQQYLAANPERHVVVLSGANSDMRTLMAVIDSARRAGVESVPVGALD